jgi:polysaccharide export outer membrane protein
MRGTSGIGALLLATGLALSGCGVTYVSPLVSEREGDNVRVVPMTALTVAMANRAPYVPRSLPEVFSQVTGSGSVTATGATLPPAPIMPNLAPGQLELRPPPPVTAQPYRLGVGDVIQLAVRPTSEDLTSGLATGRVTASEIRQTYTVRDDGSIAVPQVGAVAIGGLTIEEAEQRLFERFVETGVDPDFSLEIAQFNAQRITIGGAVSEPTILPVTLVLPTLDEALTEAGGLELATPEFASIRIYRDGTLYQIPMRDYTQRGDLRSLTLAPGDSVFVDTEYDLDRALDYYAQQIQIAGLRRSDRSAALNELSTEIALRRGSLEEQRGLFAQRVELGAEDRDYVYLTGEVTEQGRYPLPYGQQASLADALFETGGFQTETGNPSQIYVLRPNSDASSPEAVTAWHLDARNAANLTLATRFEMRPNDIIFVEEQPITRWNRAFDQFFPSLFDVATGAIE